MPHLSPLPREALAEFEAGFQMIETFTGYLPNSMLTMGRRPDVLRAFMQLSTAIHAPGPLDPELRALVGFVSSTAAGCRYCQAHTGSAADKLGVPEAKLRAAFEYEWSSLFSDRERAALRLAADASMAPPAVTEAHFEELRRHFSDDEILEIALVISMFGFLNRWNDTLATQLESPPLEFARERLGAAGWEPEAHG